MPGSADLFEQEEREEIYLGGCLPSYGAKYHCFKCDADFYWNLKEANRDPQPLNLDHLKIKDEDDKHPSSIKVNISHKTK